MSGRLGSLKSRTGCDTCKVRRIRCTEEHPHCSKCTSTGRKCTYKFSIFRHQHNPNIKPLQPSSNPTFRERRCFEYYFHHAAPLLSGTLDHAFWRVYVLQLCRAEPAIWDGLISLGALFERPPVTDEACPTDFISAPAAVRYDYHRDALMWYSRSLAGLRQRIERGIADVNVLLVGTIIYIGIEFLQANYRAVLGLYRRGVQLMNSTLAESGLKTAVKGIFLRLRSQVLIFSGMSIGDDIPDQPVLDESFESIDVARNALFEMISDMKQLLLAIKSYRAQMGDPNIPGSHSLTIKQAQLEHRLHRWHSIFTSSPLIQTPQKGDTTIPTLLMNHTSILLETQVCLKSDESAYDLQKRAFIGILDYADSITTPSSSAPSSSPCIATTERQPFSFELGTFLPLFMTALKCRYPDLRRKALRLLYGTDASSAGGVTAGVQGMFLCRPAAQLVAIIVGLEEGSYPSHTPLDRQAQESELDHSVSVVDNILAQQGCIPGEENRICDFWVSSDSQAESSPPTLPFPSTQRKECIDWDGTTGKRWLHYRRYITLPFQDVECEEQGQRKTGFVTRSVPLLDLM